MRRWAGRAHNAPFPALHLVTCPSSLRRAGDGWDQRLGTGTGTNDLVTVPALCRIGVPRSSPSLDFAGSRRTRDKVIQKSAPGHRDANEPST